jgi:hypothetical protein
MQDISMHIMDLMQNSIHAGCSRLTLTVGLTSGDEYLEIKLEDDGNGMSREVQEKAVDPFYTSRDTRDVGLGISLFKGAVEIAEGKLFLFSEEGKGTGIRGLMKNRSIDRQPLGNVGNLVFLHMLSHPDIPVKLHIYRGPASFTFDSDKWIESREEAGATATDAAFMAEAMVEEEIKKIFQGGLPEMGGGSDAVK